MAASGQWRLDRAAVQFRLEPGAVFLPIIATCVAARLMAARVRGRR